MSEITSDKNIATISLESPPTREVPAYIVRIEELEREKQERIKYEEELKLRLKQIEHKLEYITNENIMRIGVKERTW